MKFLSKMIKTNVDFKGFNSLLIHSLVGCNLKCFGCHNYEELVKSKHETFYDDEDVLSRIKSNGFLFDAIIFSGGEFLMNDLDKMIEFLSRVRDVFKGKIIINTNGCYPLKIKKLSELRLVDGFHMDLKFYIWETPSEQDVKVVGMGISKHTRECMVESFDELKLSNLNHNEFRTVKYPFLEEEFFRKIQYKCEKENVIWRVNPFLE